MTERKFKSYTLWMKWRDYGWSPSATCLNRPFTAESPIKVLSFYMQNYSTIYWKRGKTWMILPEDRKPAEMEAPKGCPKALNKSTSK